MFDLEQVFIKRFGPFCEVEELKLEGCGASNRGLGKMVMKTFPDGLGCLTTNGKRNNGLGQRSSEVTDHKLVLLNPYEQSRIGNRSSRSIGGSGGHGKNSSGRLWVRAINELVKTLANKEWFHLAKPFRIIVFI